ncbi:hypothetical protein GUJ93_ZPchr0013g35611 [Zizania palustris]|uniref:Uncharacterized protein n=1 Tax=Zizania palustris TaxID=103762 RepID=A0A8J5WZ85_ZIZPA|nr:hypothetical protein GUJ93_ZPchr0013g35611 [Zizania palustris]
MNIKGGGRVPVPPAGAGMLAKLVVLGGMAVYVAVNSLYNVEGGHRAIVFILQPHPGNQGQGPDTLLLPISLPLVSPLLPCAVLGDGVNDSIV